MNEIFYATMFFGNCLLSFFVVYICYEYLINNRSKTGNAIIASIIMLSVILYMNIEFNVSDVLLISNSLSVISVFFGFLYTLKLSTK